MEDREPRGAQSSSENRTTRVLDRLKVPFGGNRPSSSTSHTASKLNSPDLPTHTTPVDGEALSTALVLHAKGLIPPQHVLVPSTPSPAPVIHEPEALIPAEMDLDDIDPMLPPSIQFSSTRFDSEAPLSQQPYTGQDQNKGELPYGIRHATALDEAEIGPMPQFYEEPGSGGTEAPVWNKFIKDMYNYMSLQWKLTADASYISESCLLTIGATNERLDLLDRKHSRASALVQSELSDVADEAKEARRCVESNMAKWDQFTAEDQRRDETVNQLLKEVTLLREEVAHLRRHAPLPQSTTPLSGQVGISNKGNHPSSPHPRSLPSSIPNRPVAVTAAAITADFLSSQVDRSTPPAGEYNSNPNPHLPSGGNTSQSNPPPNNTDQDEEMYTQDIPHPSHTHPPLHQISARVAFKAGYIPQHVFDEYPHMEMSVNSWKVFGQEDPGDPAAHNAPEDTREERSS